MGLIRIAGIGAYTPDNIVTNDELSKIVDTNDQWISSRTGIKQRRISIDENTSDLATKAALDALKDANISGEEIELIILATTTSDSLIPSMACKVQRAIGAKNAVSFDIAAACSGLLYAMSIAKSFITSGVYKKALVIGSEVLSKVINWEDRNTCVLFGDGASAIIIEKSDFDGIPFIEIGSDPTKYEVLTSNGIGLNNPFAKEDTITNHYVEMNGKEVFKFAVNIIEESIRKLLNEQKLSIEDIDHIVCHQANYRIIDYVSKSFEGNKEKFYMNLQDYGNTSSASIGIALDEMNKKGLLKNGHRIILVGFGGGLTWGAALINWQR
ncbi:beta-ketoacyl-ACP synthase III [Clostridium sp.]|uniref:beta-ketoacyl-ACP synthase III n=1 Tax=Clostridium sp. TaxID=1506 RepID=UPI0032175914